MADLAEILKAKGSADPTLLAVAIMKAYEASDGGIIMVRAIGAGAVHTALEAVGRTSDLLETTLWCRIKVTTVETDRGRRSATDFTVRRVDTNNLAFVAKEIDSVYVHDSMRMQELATGIASNLSPRNHVIEFVSNGAVPLYTVVKASHNATRVHKQLRLVPEVEEIEVRGGKKDVLIRSRLILPM